MMHTHVLAWSPNRAGLRLGFADIAFSTGLVLRYVAIFANRANAWAQPPARSYVDFSNHHVRKQFNDEVIGALVRFDPSLAVDLGVRETAKVEAS